MAIKITLEQVKSQLSTMGFVTSDFTLNTMLSIVDGIDDCLDSSEYSDDVVKLIKLYSVILLLSSSDVRKVSSESSPSGASRSYQYFDDSKALLLASLNKLDPNGCTTALPIVRASTLIQFNVRKG